MSNETPSNFGEPEGTVWGALMPEGWVDPNRIECTGDYDCPIPTCDYDDCAVDRDPSKEELTDAERAEYALEGPDNPPSICSYPRPLRADALDSNPENGGTDG